jgi:transcriptional regulator NrdR family protein
MDTIAYIRFACVYRRFKHVDELKDAIENIETTKAGIQESV